MDPSALLQDLFVGAWQQADPAVDQVPYTFPPVLAANPGKVQPKANKKAKKSKSNLPRLPKATQRHKTGQDSTPVVQTGEAAACAKQQTAGKAKAVGVSAADYAQALYEDL